VSMCRPITGRDASRAPWVKQSLLNSTQPTARRMPHDGAMETRANCRYFVYGLRYIPPAIYVRVDADGQTFVVDPDGIEERTTAPISRWLERVSAGWMAEATKEEITAAIAEWNRTKSPRLKPP
jgi:hypothetical protein